MRRILPTFALLVFATPAYSQDASVAERMLAKASEWHACVVTSAAKAGMRSKQSPDDVAAAFLDECDYEQLFDLAVQAAKSSSSERYGEDVYRGVAQRLLGGERVRVQAEARSAVVKARIRAGL